MNAYAYVIGPPDGAGAELFAMAQALGFVGVSSFRGIGQVEQQTLATPICYFLFAAVAEPTSLRPLVEAVRFCPKGRVRFSPMIYCAQEPSIDVIRSCVGLGFDDIIALPLPLRQLRQRVARQVGPPLTYYETASYFGPDRRAARATPPGPDDKRVGGPYRRIEMVRSFHAGIAVLNDAVFPPRPAVAEMQTLP